MVCDHGHRTQAEGFPKPELTDVCIPAPGSQASGMTQLSMAGEMKQVKGSLPRNQKLFVADTQNGATQSSCIATVQPGSSLTTILLHVACP